MKKTFAYTVLFLLFSSTINAQLTDTKWRNFMNIPDSYETIMHFKKDTAILTLAADGSLVETMTYSVTKDTLRLTKVSGLSGCDDNTGLYRIQIKDDRLTIEPISDDCYDRVNAFKPEPWTREKI
ncbi:MAG TPA: hypothetical protein VFH08_20380 [Chitinophagaceae bacterium]|nr:hypothetical protein [Chitinophagaceae bacterium]